MIVRDQAIGKLEDRGTPQRVEEDGYAIFRDVLAAGEIQHLIGELEDSNLPHSRAGVRHLLSHPAIAQVASDPRLLKLARDVLGVDMFPFRTTLFDKSPDSNWLITWHQDTALPLRVLPGTHMLGVLTDHEVEECVDMIQSVNCLAPKGGVIMMRPLTVHASPKSQSSIPRRVLHIEYTTPQAITPPLKLAIA